VGDREVGCKIYGASDDLIEVDGDIREEFYHSEDGVDLLAFSDGTLLSVEYDNSGMWRINRLMDGTSRYTKDEATAEEGNREDGLPAYSDVVTLTPGVDRERVRWIVHGVSWARQR